MREFDCDTCGKIKDKFNDEAWLIIYGSTDCIPKYRCNACENKLITAGCVLPM